MEQARQRQYLPNLTKGHKLKLCFLPSSGKKIIIIINHDDKKDAFWILS